MTNGAPLEFFLVLLLSQLPENLTFFISLLYQVTWVPSCQLPENLTFFISFLYQVTWVPSCLEP